MFNMKLLKLMLYSSFLFNIEFDKSPAKSTDEGQKLQHEFKIQLQKYFLNISKHFHIRIFRIDKSISLNHQFLKYLLSTKN